MNSHSFEQEVIEILADYLGYQGDDFWGYVTNGGTEGNMAAIWFARSKYPNGIVYFSEDTHYSINKIMDILKLKKLRVKSLETGKSITKTWTKKYRKMQITQLLSSLISALLLKEQSII